MTTTPSPSSPSNLRPAIAPPPPAVGLSVRDAPPKPRPPPPAPNCSQANPVNQLLAVPQPTRPTRPTTTRCQVRNTRPTRSPSHRSGLSQSSAPSPPDPGPEQPDLRPASLAPARSPSSQAYPQPAPASSRPTGQLPSCLPSSCLFTNTDIPSVAYKTPCNFYREGTILPVFALPVDTNIPGTHWGAPGISVKDQSVHLMILVTRPEPTVRPPSRIAKPRPSSMAMGWIS